MTPTMKLRWVERKTWRVLPGGPSDGCGNAIVLQQWWWESDYDCASGVPRVGEWRDVPIEKEKES